jgi:hypothetical protein
MFRSDTTFKPYYCKIWRSYSVEGQHAFCNRVRNVPWRWRQQISPKAYKFISNNAFRKCVIFCLYCLFSCLFNDDFSNIVEIRSTLDSSECCVANDVAGSGRDLF